MFPFPTRSFTGPVVAAEAESYKSIYGTTYCVVHDRCLQTLMGFLKYDAA